MAKILLNVYWNGEGAPPSKCINAFFEGFIDTLVESGNDVYLLLSNEFTYYWQGNLGLRSSISKTFFDSLIKKIKPDVLFSFNHTFCNELPKILDCPIVVWFVDPPNCQPELDKYKANASKYFSIFPNAIDCEATIRELNLSSKNAFVVKDATALRARPTPQTRNIVFLGSRFEIEWRLREFFKEGLATEYFNDFARNLWNEFRKFPNKNMAELCESIGWSDFYKQHRDRANQLHSAMQELLAAETRQNVLRAVADLGLHLIGPSRWLDLLRFSMDLGSSYEELTVFSLGQTEALYNSALIGVNINHAYTKLGFSWRARDVMASNAVLLTNQNMADDLKYSFGPNVKVPVFSSPAEAREISKKLIQEPNWRRDIVESSHEIIEDGHRFSHRLKLIEEYLEISLHNHNSLGSLSELKAMESNPIQLIKHAPQLLKPMAKAEKQSPDLKDQATARL